MTEELKDALVKNIRRRMTPQPLKIRADIEMKCFQFDGVLHIKVLILIFLIWSPNSFCLIAIFMNDHELVVKSIISFKVLNYYYFMFIFDITGCHAKS